MTNILRYVGATGLVLLIAACGETSPHGPPQPKPPPPIDVSPIKMRQSFETLRTDIKKYRPHIDFLAAADEKLAAKFSSCVFGKNAKDCRNSLYYFNLNAEPKNTLPVIRIVHYYPNGQAKKPSCTGTVIAPTKILTAAHCVSYVSNSNHLFSYGKNYVGIQSSDDRLHNIEKITLHPKYRARGPQHDVAVVTLEEPIDIKPFPLSKTPPKIGEYVTRIGRNRGYNIDAVCQLSKLSSYNDFLCTSGGGDSGGPYLGIKKDTPNVYGMHTHSGGRGPTWKTIHDFYDTHMDIK